ncbi:hypothetical protein DM01DRAFT_1395221, partial [Hesseltinella vesiculosa]
FTFKKRSYLNSSHLLFLLFLSSSSDLYFLFYFFTMATSITLPSSMHMTTPHRIFISPLPPPKLPRTTSLPTPEHPPRSTSLSSSSVVPPSPCQPHPTYRVCPYQVVSMKQQQHDNAIKKSPAVKCYKLPLINDAVHADRPTSKKQKTCPPSIPSRPDPLCLDPRSSLSTCTRSSDEMIYSPSSTLLSPTSPSTHCHSLAKFSLQPPPWSPVSIASSASSSSSSLSSASDFKSYPMSPRHPPVLSSSCQCRLALNHPVSRSYLKSLANPAQFDHILKFGYQRCPCHDPQIRPCRHHHPDHQPHWTLRLTLTPFMDIHC